MTQNAFFKEVFATVLDYSIDLYAYVDIKNTYQYISKSYAHFYDFEVKDLIGESPKQVFDQDTYRNIVEPNLAKCIAEKAPVNFESWILAKKAEEPVYLYTSYLPHVSKQTNEVVGVIVISKDVSEFKRAEGLLSQSANTDALTGIPNRLYLENKLNVLTESYHRSSDRFALLFLDLDGFKEVNDSYGHAVGDKVLYQVASRLSKNVRAQDIVARYGGDEFVVLISPLVETDVINIVKNKIERTISQPFDISGHKITIGVSIGTSVSPDETFSVDDLINFADRRMYHNKNKKMQRK